MELMFQIGAVVGGFGMFAGIFAAGFLGGTARIEELDPGLGFAL